MLMRNSNTGALEVYDIANNAITSAGPMGQVGLEWQVAGFGDFSGNVDETDMLMRNSNTGAFELYDISNNGITLATGMGQVGTGMDGRGLWPFFRQPQRNRYAVAQLKYWRVRALRHPRQRHHVGDWYGPSRTRMVGRRCDGCAARATRPGDGFIRTERGRARCGAAARTTGDVARCDRPVGSAKRVMPQSSLTFRS